MSKFHSEFKGETIEKLLQKVYDGAAGIKMGGEPITVTRAVGGLTVGDEINDDENIWEVIRRLVNPVTVQQANVATIGLSGRTPAVNSLTYEIGSSIVKRLIPNWNNGAVNASGTSPAVGGVPLIQYRLQQQDGANWETIFVHDGPSSPPQHERPIHQLTESISFRAQIDHGDGPIPRDSEDNERENLRRLGRVNVASSVVTFVPQRRIFWGVFSNPVLPGTVPVLDSDFFRNVLESGTNGGSRLHAANNRSIAVNTIEGTFGAFFAFPANLGEGYSLFHSGMPGNNAINDTNVVGRMIVPIVGAEDYNAIDYNVYFVSAEGASGAVPVTYTFEWR